MRRGLCEFSSRPARHARGGLLAGAPAIAEKRAPLWRELSPAEFPLTAGKVENLRRAALYGLEKPTAGNELLRAVLQRAAAAGPGNRLAWFDAAYLIETLRQAGQMEDRNPLALVTRPSSA